MAWEPSCVALWLERELFHDQQLAGDKGGGVLYAEASPTQGTTLRAFWPRKRCKREVGLTFCCSCHGFTAAARENVERKGWEKKETLFNRYY